jgi:carbon monoxide dehydrogenase subunit G
VQFSNEFTAPAAPDEVFATLMDVRGVAGCLPGASIGEDTEDGGLEATVAVKVGPIRMSYGGTVHVVERDDTARTATMRVRAREQRGQGTAEATLGLAVAEDGSAGGSKATVTTDLMVTGRVAQMGAGIMQDVAGSMVDDFAACLSARLAGPSAAPAAPEAADAVASPPPSPPAQQTASEVKALPLLWRALRARLGRLFGRR